MLATMWNILVEMYIGTTTWETKLKFNMHILNAFSIIFLYIFPRKILAQVDQKMWWLILSVDWPQGAQIFGQTLFWMLLGDCFLKLIIYSHFGRAGSLLRLSLVVEHRLCCMQAQ